MTFTEAQLQRFVRFHEAHAATRGGDPPKLDHQFAAATQLRRDELGFIVSNRAALEEAARAAGLIA